MTILFEKSFGSHPKSKFWSEINKLKPNQVTISSGKKFWFNCDKCNHIFEIALDKITCGNNWCSYCSNHRLCDNDLCKICYNKSFATHDKSIYWSNKNILIPRQVFKSSNIKFWFNCNKCSHDFDCTLSHISNMKSWCPYCSNTKLCENNDCKECFNKSFASHEHSKYWSTKNDKNINLKKLSICNSKKFWFKCENNHEFEKQISNNTWCPKCKNKTELKLLNWLEVNYTSINTQITFNWCKIKRKLPYDFIIKDYNIIIELDGQQHFKQISNWKPPEETQVYDNYKNKMALENGYTVVRICQEIVLYNKENWENQLANAIKKYNNPKLIKIGSVYNLAA